MSIDSNYEGITHTVHLSTASNAGCHLCRFQSRESDPDDLSEMINHYIEAHGYRLLHVGTQTIHDDDGEPTHATVAILGR